MKFSNLKRQRGVILAFSLVMLLLLTLAGTRMIQQNKQQLEMARNARLLTQEFANAEAVLSAEKKLINSTPAHDNYLSDDYFSASAKLAINDPKHQCTPIMTTPYKQNQGLAASILETDTVTVRILQVSCMTSTGIITQICSRYAPTPNTNTGIRTCKIDPLTGVGENCPDTESGLVNLFTGSTNACYQDYDPQCKDTNAATCLATPKCPREIYTIQVISTNPNGGASREITSDYDVACGT